MEQTKAFKKKIPYLENHGFDFPDLNISCSNIYEGMKSDQIINC